MFKVRYKHIKYFKKPIKKPSGPQNVKVGLPYGEADSEIIKIAVWNHFGTNTIPERPFLENAIEDNRDEYRAILKKSARKILRGETRLSTVISKLGLLAQGHIQDEITDLYDPENADVTIEMKGSSNPLIDSGDLRASITWKVNK